MQPASSAEHPDSLGLSGRGGVQVPLGLAAASGPATRGPHGARSEEAVLVGDLLVHEVPALASDDLEIVAIARRSGVLAKVVVRRHPGAPAPSRWPVRLVVGVGGDHVLRVREQLGGDQVHVIQWHRDPALYVAEALGLNGVPPEVVMPLSRLVHVLLGEIDYRVCRAVMAPTYSEAHRTCVAPCSQLGS
jgi:hypothetical protein